MSGVEKVTDLTSEKVLGYFETVKSVFYVKMAMINWFYSGDVVKHRALSAAAAEMAGNFGDDFMQRGLNNITEEVVENLKEDATTALIVSSWSVFEQIIKDLTVPDYSTHPSMLQADYHNGILGYSQGERAEIGLFYHLRNAIVHYNGAFHAYRTVDITYAGTHFKSEGHFGEKIVVSPKLAMSICDDLQKYAMKAWSHLARP
ncbi:MULTISPECIES: hypothetical protein [Methylobacteriaceae]|uniref:hypothetical protein n=1 Tax=Methylobacteriaceae TaxID=119045 RepID=UPI002F3598AB